MTSAYEKQLALYMMQVASDTSAVNPFSSAGGTIAQQAMGHFVSVNAYGRYYVQPPASAIPATQISDSGCPRSVCWDCGIKTNSNGEKNKSIYGFHLEKSGKECWMCARVPSTRTSNDRPTGIASSNISHGSGSVSASRGYPIDSRRSSAGSHHVTRGYPIDSRHSSEASIGYPIDSRHTSEASRGYPIDSRHTSRMYPIDSRHTSGASGEHEYRDDMQYV